MDSRAELNLQKFDPILGYVGGEPVQRGGREIVETVARLASDYPRIGALIVGSRSPDLLRLAEHRNVAERCRFPGVVPYEEVPRYLHAFDIGFALDRAERVKIVGNSYQKLRQYVACGIPSVASPGGSEFLSEHDLGSIVDVSDLDAIERETRRWLSLTHHDRASFPERASTYAREHLSTERALRDRLEFWDSRLSVHVSTRRTA